MASRALQRRRRTAAKGVSRFFDLDVGYMLSFNFNKNKEQGVKQVHIGNKVIYEGVL